MKAQCSQNGQERHLNFIGGPESQITEQMYEFLFLDRFFIRNISESQNLRFIIESGFKSRAGYNDAHMVDAFLSN